MSETRTPTKNLDEEGYRRKSQSDLATSALDSVTTSKGPQARSPASSAGDAMVGCEQISQRSQKL
eukprot:1241901-Amphidinium_carterae.1